MAVLFLGVLHGVLAGGDATIAVWSIRGMVLMYLAYVRTDNVVQTRCHVRILFWIFIIGVGLKGLLSYWRFFVDLGADLSRIEAVVGRNSLMAHEETFFFLLALLGVLASFVFRGLNVDRKVWLMTAVLVFLPMLANERRAGIAALVMGVALLLFLAYGLLKENAPY